METRRKKTRRQQGKNELSFRVFLTLGLLAPKSEANGAKIINNVAQLRKKNPELSPILGALFKP